MVAAAKKIRTLGRQLVDASMLIFVCGRYEFRKACLLAYGPVAQSLVIAGLEKQMWQEVVDMRMGRMIGRLQALFSSLRVLDLLLFGVVPHVHVRSAQSASISTFAAVVSQVPVHPVCVYQQIVFVYVCVCVCLGLFAAGPAGRGAARWVSSV